MMMMMMDDEVYKAAEHEKTVPSNKLNEDLLRCRTRGVESNNIIHVAAHHGNADFIKTLPQLAAFGDHRSYYALLCQPNSRGETPLHLAAESGDKATVQSLLDAHDHSCSGFVDDREKKLCWREKDGKRGDTPLHTALRYGHEDIAMLLLGRDANLVSFVNNVGETPSYLAANSFCQGFLKTILNPGWEGHASVSFSGPRGTTVFHPARKLTEEIMLALIKAAGKELLKKQDEDKRKTVLHYAVEESIEVMVKTLLKADSSLACVHDKDDMTPLHRASSMGFFTVLATILELSPQSILEVTDQGKTALHVAKRDAGFVRVCLGNTRMKQLINVADNQGNTPLHVVLAENSRQHQLDVKVSDKQGSKTLGLALDKPSTPHKLDVNMADDRGNTLHLALAHNSDPYLDVADALLEVDGINWRLENNDGCTPLDLCQSDDKIPLKLKSLAREWRRVKEGLNMELFKQEGKKSIDLVRSNWDELLKYRGPYGDSILHIAARDEEMNLIKRAIQEPNDPRVHDLLISGENSRGETPLHMAAAAGKLKAVKAILSLATSTSDIDRTIRNKKQMHSLHHHTRDQDQQLEVDIIDSDDHQVCREPWKTKSENGDTPAHKALRNGHYHVALHLLQNYPCLVSFVTNDGESLLYLAALHARGKVVDEIVSISRRSTTTDSTFITSGPHGQNPLHAAARSTGGYVPEIPDASFINRLKNNVLALSTATSTMLPWVGTRVVRRWKELLNKVDDCGKTPLHYAAEIGHPKAVKKLLSEGDKTAAFMYDNQGFTPLLRAAANGHGFCTHLILQMCPRSIELPHATSHKTALHLSTIPSVRTCTGYLWEYTLSKCLTKHPQMSRLINETDTEGNTPLHCAIIQSDQDKAIRLLLTPHVKSDIRNKQDQTPVDLCQQRLTKGDKNQHAIWVALESAKVGEWRLPRSVISCIKCLLAHNDLLLRSSDEDLMKLLNNISVAATLLVTLTFAATFAIPGGYGQDKTNCVKQPSGSYAIKDPKAGDCDYGKAVRIKEFCIQLFVASDAVAMIFGIGVLMKYTVGVIHKRAFLGKVTLECILLLYCAVLATIVAFISGVYAIVSEEAMWIATLCTVLSSIIFVFCLF